MNKVTSRKLTLDIEMTTEHAAKQLKNYVGNVKRAMESISKGTDNFIVFKQLIEYLGQIDELFGEIKQTLGDDALTNVVGKLDSNMLHVMEKTFSVTKEQLALLDQLKMAYMQLNVFGVTDENIDQLKNLESAVKELFTTIGHADAAKITGRGNPKTRLQKLGEAFKNFGMIFDSVQGRVAEGFQIGGVGAGMGAIADDLAGANKKITNEMLELENSAKNYQRILNIFGGANANVKPKKKEDIQILNGLVKRFNEAKLAAEKLAQAGDMSSDDYKKQITNAYQYAAMLVDTAEYVQANGSEKGQLLAMKLNSATGTASLAKNYMESIKNDKAFEMVRKHLERKVQDANERIAELKKAQAEGVKKSPATKAKPDVKPAGDNKKAILSYSELIQKVERYISLQDKLNKIQKGSPVWNELSKMQSQIADTFETMTQLNDDEQETLYNIIDDMSEEGANAQAITARLCELFKIEIPQSVTTATSAFDQIGKHAVDTTEYIRGMTLALSEMFSVLSKPMDVEYKVLINGQEMDIKQGQNGETSRKTTAEAFLSNLTKDVDVDAHSHQGLSAKIDSADFNNAILRQHSGLAKISAIIGPQHITTLDLAKVKAEDAHRALEKLRELSKKPGTPSASPEELSQILTDINPEYQNVVQTWKPEQFGELAKKIYDTKQNAEQVLPPLEKLKGLLVAMGVKQENLSKYESLFETFSEANASNIFNQVMNAEGIKEDGKILQAGETTSKTLHDITQDVQNQVSAFANLRESAGVTFNELAAAVEDYAQKYHTAEGKNVEFFKKYFHASEMPDIHKMFMDVGSGYRDLSGVTRELAEMFGIEVDEDPAEAIEQIGTSAQKSSQEVAELRQELEDVRRENEQLRAEQTTAGGQLTGASDGADKNALNLADKLKIIKDIAKVQSELDKARLEENDTSELDEQFDAFKNKYYGIIATLADGSKIKIALDDEFDDAVQNILKDAKKIQDIELLPANAGKAIEAYERLERILNSMKTRFGSYEKADPGEVYHEWLPVLTNAIADISSGDPEFKFGSKELYQRGMDAFPILQEMSKLYKREPVEDQSERVEQLERQNALLHAENIELEAESASHSRAMEEMRSYYAQETIQLQTDNDALRQDLADVASQRDSFERQLLEEKMSHEATRNAADQRTDQASMDADVMLHAQEAASSVVTKQMEELKKLEDYLKQLQNLVNNLFSNITPPENAFEPLKADIDHIEASVNNIVNSINSIKGFATKSNTDNPDDATLNVDFASLFTPIQKVLDQIYGVLKGFTGIAASSQDSVEVKKPVEQTRAAELRSKATEYTDIQRFVRDNVQTLMSVGVNNNEAATALWRDANYSREDLQPVAMAMEDVANIIRTKIPENILDGWFRSADSPYKSRLEHIALSDTEVRNAALNAMWHNFREYSKQDIGFEEFLHSNIPVYRGKNSEKYVDGDELLSFTFDRSVAEKFGNHILEAIIRPIDTIGAYQTTGENEVMVRRDKLEQLPEFQTWLDNMSSGMKESFVQATAQVARQQEQDGPQQTISAESISSIWQEFNTLIQKIRNTINSVTADLGRAVGKQSITQGGNGQPDMAQPGTFAQEVAIMEDLRGKVEAVANLVEAKNNAFDAEPGIVKTAVERELVELNSLKTNLEDLKTFIGTIFENMKVPEDTFKLLTPIIEQVKALSAELQTLHSNFALQGVSDALPDAQLSSTWLSDLAINIDAVANAINAKTAAFKQEDEVVRAAVQAETETLTNLKGLLVEIQNVLQTIFSVDVQKFGNVDFEQDKNNVNAVSGVLQNINTLLTQIYGVLQGYTGIEAQNKKSVKVKEPVANESKRTEDQTKRLSVLDSILVVLQHIEGYLSAKPFESIKTSIDQLTDVAKAKDNADKSEKSRTKDSLSQLINTLTPAVKTLQDVAKGIVTYQQSAKSKTDVADRRIADTESYNLIKTNALNAVKDRVMKDNDGNVIGDSDITGMKALPNGIVQVTGYIQTAADAWEGFTLKVDEANKASEIAFDVHSKAAKEAAKRAKAEETAAKVAEQESNRLEESEVSQRALARMRELDKEGKKAKLSYSDSGAYTVTTEETIGGLSKKTSQVFDGNIEGDAQKKSLRTIVSLSNEAADAIRKTDALIVQNTAKIGNVDLLNKYTKAHERLIELNDTYKDKDSFTDKELTDWNTAISLVQQYGQELSALISRQNMIDSQSEQVIVAERLRKYQSDAKKIFGGLDFDLNAKDQSDVQKEISEVYAKILKLTTASLKNVPSAMDTDVERMLNLWLGSLSRKAKTYANDNKIDMTDVEDRVSNYANREAQQGRQVDVKFKDDGTYVVKTLEKIGGLSKQVVKTFDANGNKINEVITDLSNGALAEVEQLRAKVNLGISQGVITGGSDAQRFGTELSKLNDLTQNFGDMSTWTDDQVLEWEEQLKVVRALGKEIVNLIDLRRQLGSSDEMLLDAQELSGIVTAAKKYAKGLNDDLLPTSTNKSEKQQAFVDAYEQFFKKTKYLKDSKTKLTDDDRKELGVLLNNLETASENRRAELESQRLPQQTFAQDLESQQNGLDAYRKKLQGVDVVACALNQELDALILRLGRIAESGTQDELDAWKEDFDDLQGRISNDLWQVQHEKLNESAGKKAQVKNLFRGLDFDVNGLNLTSEQQKYADERVSILNALDKIEHDDIKQGRVVDFTEIEGRISKLSLEVAEYRERIKSLQEQDKQKKNRYRHCTKN